jgi:hypothetical protein
MKAKRLLIMVGFIAQFWAGAGLSDEPAPTLDKWTAQEIMLAVAPPPKDRLTLLSMVPLTVGGELLGGVAAYDDAATSRPTDYLELFNNSGTLLAVGWFDRFGIERLAVDRGLAEEADSLQGVLVLILVGDPI